ncbi:MAG: ergothioneine biosynthesis protein EgtB [Pseudomonadales bacterium]
MTSNIHFSENQIVTPVNSTLLRDRFETIRRQTEHICSELTIEDHCIQPRAEVSPPKWHMAHTTWFFEEVILKKFAPEYSNFDPVFAVLFNSYYKSVGEHTPQSQRGFLSRPSVEQVYAYRAAVDRAIAELINSTADLDAIAPLVELGLQHEQQHQELLYMDIKAILAENLEQPAYCAPTAHSAEKSTAARQLRSRFEEGLYEIGNDTSAFMYDNESPVHKHYLYSFEIDSHLVSNAEFEEFIDAGGYQQAQWWLSEGWEWVNQNAISHPLYWSMTDQGWQQFTLFGARPLPEAAPVSHVSYFEADAYARWRKQRLPTEQELETWLSANHSAGDQSEPSIEPFDLAAVDNQVWCWTASQYTAYPRFTPYDGDLAEYNGKFMCNQFVLRGACAATPIEHYRPSYRNFFKPEQRWMFSGIRLAKDI